ncbi:hypothetical protein PR048_004008, partial [Dryococelus australis]
MVIAGIIQEADSPYSAPSLVISKKNRGLRYLTDFRKLNQYLTRVQYPLPRTEDILNALQNSSYITSLDLFSGFYSIPVRPRDCFKLAFTIDGDRDPHIYKLKLALLNLDQADKYRGLSRRYELAVNGEIFLTINTPHGPSKLTLVPKFILMRLYKPNMMQYLVAGMLALLVQFAKKPKSINSKPMGQSTSIPPQRKTWALDAKGPLPTTTRKNKYILVMTEYATCYVVAKAVPSIDTVTCAEFIKQVVLQSTSFQNELITNRLKSLGIKKLTTTAYNPRCNCLVEASN